MSNVGITTTVPVEVILAAGHRPVDLNNVFISDPHPERLVTLAERQGFPMNCCTWIKGMYGACVEHGVGTVVCVTSGDCSNTVMLMEVLRLRGFNVISFAYPEEPDAAGMERAIAAFATALGTTVEEAEATRRKLEGPRALAEEADRATWSEGTVSGWENHYWLVSTSDFLGDYDEYGRLLSQFLGETATRTPYPEETLRLAYIGVPSVFAKDLYRFVETQGARVVFNEVQRQFSMPGGCGSLGGQYSDYTYPYSIRGRVRDIVSQLELRRIDGVIHYVQAFCHRGIGDIIFRESIGLPVLTLEGNNDFLLTQHLQTRVEAFIDMIRRRRSGGGARSATSSRHG